MNLYIGIDWSEQKHDIAFMNEAGAVISQLTVAHKPEGLAKFDQVRQQLGLAAPACLIGLETAHNLVIDYLWAHDYQQVYVIPPSVVKSNRGRYGSSGGRTDEHDAKLLADLLRTDRSRLRPWRPDSLLTRQLRAELSLLNYLTRQKVRHTNRLRAILLRYYPVALEIFSGLDTRIVLQFIRAYPSPAAARQLTLAEFETFAKSHGYYRQQRYLKDRFARLQQAHLNPSLETVQVYQTEAATLAQLLLHTLTARYQVEKQLEQHLLQHPDYAIFNSLPGAGPVITATLIVKFGDDRRRFPTPAAIQSLAGTCPVTEQSGKRRVVYFRYGCDRQFRRTLHLWAMHSVGESVWASSYFQQRLPRSHSNSHAYRCLANRWLAIAWKLWQSRQTYDEAYHLQQRALRSRPKN